MTLFSGTLQLRVGYVKVDFTSNYRVQEKRGSLNPQPTVIEFGYINMVIFYCGSILFVCTFIAVLEELD